MAGLAGLLVMALGMVVIGLLVAFGVMDAYVLREYPEPFSRLAGVMFVVGGLVLGGVTAAVIEIERERRWQS